MTVAATANGAEKKKTSGFVKGVLYIMGFGIASSMLSLMAGKDRGAKQQSAVAASDPKPSSDDICRDHGDAIATAYFANIKGAIDAGVVSSEMMRNGCEQRTAGRGEECFKLCQDGFKCRAQQWVKNK